MTLFGLLYDLGLHLYACAALPKLALHFRKYKKSFKAKLGLGFPLIEKGGRQLIWIHAVSLGETKAVAPLVKRLKSLKNPPLILLSTTTQTGHAEGLKSSPTADYHVFLPFDFSYIIRRIVKKTSPNLLILTETDFWYHFQDAAKECGAELVVINGKISERSYKRLTSVPFLARNLFHSIDHFYVQGELYKNRFADLKVPLTKITVTGNLKLDSEVEYFDPASLKQKLGLGSHFVLTLGSTHDPEEQIWIAALKKIWLTHPHLKVILVPRHPERFNEVAKLLASENIPYSRWSEEGTFEHASVLLVDAMGVLRKCYQICDLAFVGGSLTEKVGGHNILEPAFYGKPVLFGPYMHSQPDLLDLVHTFEAGLQVTNETLMTTLTHLINNPAERTKLGFNGQKLIASSRGALDKTFNALLPLLQKNAS